MMLRPHAEPGVQKAVSAVPVKLEVAASQAPTPRERIEESEVLFGPWRSGDSTRMRVETARVEGVQGKIEYDPDCPVE